jgi:hypothetical protein
MSSPGVSCPRPPIQKSSALLDQSLVPPRLLTARVSVPIDVRGEEVQTGATSITESACLGRDDCSDLEHKVIVKGRRSQDRLGKRSRVGELAAGEGEVDSWASGDAVEGFGPEVVGVQTEARDGGLVTLDGQCVQWIKVQFKRT